ncbi:MAG: hypothetical protein ACRC41_08650 [Sarcina sp.]
METFILVLPIIILFSIFILWGLVGYWVYKDACIYSSNPIMWTVIVLVFNQSFIGLLLYFVVGRKKDFYKCKNCGKMNNKDSKYCNNCGDVIGENLFEEIEPISKKRKKNFIIIIILLVSFIFISFAGLIALTFNMFNDDKSVIVEEVKTSNEEFIDDSEVRSENFLSDFTNTRFNKFITQGVSFFSLDTKTDNSMEVKAKKINRKTKMEVEIKDPLKEKLYIYYKGKSTKQAAFSITQESIGVMDEIDLTNNKDEETIEIDLSKYKAGAAKIEIILNGKEVSFRLEIK